MRSSLWSIMWPRRSSAATTAKAAPSNAPPPTPPTPAAPAATAAKTDDCGWLLRAVASKNKKKTAPSGTGGASSVSVGWASRSNGGDGDGLKNSKKRPLDAKQGNAKPQPASKLPRGIGWSQPNKARPAKPVSVDPASRAPDLPVAAPGESFEEVFAEIYGRTKTPTPAVIDDDETPSLPLTSSLFLPDHPSQQDGPSAPSGSPLAKAATPQSLPSSRKASGVDEKWDFAKPSAIQLDAFTVASGKKTNADGTPARTDHDATFARWKDERSSHAVSDNFVRLNMRKRVKGSTGKAKKLPAYLRSRGFVDAEEKAQLQQKAGSNADIARPGGSGGLLDDGIDFIEECLELLKRHEARPEDTRPGEPSAAVEEGEPPRCQHALVCARVLVKKKNKNHGRAFFSCPLGYDEGRCDFFLWEENHGQFALQHLLQPPHNGDAEQGESREDDPTAKYVPLDLAKPIEKQAKAMLTNLRVVFGHAEFRAGQQWAIQRIFRKQRTLLVLPTGAGKSLCYQYPALFLPGITIVISPLISLMNDQFHNLPPVLKRQATCVALSSSSKTQYAEFVRDLLGGKLKLLFVSPEKALTSGFQRLLLQMQSRISLVCVDEAHCISEWSHHFRPSYLRLASVFALADSVLAITATASKRVERDILSQLTELPQGSQLEVDDEEKPDDETEKSVLRMPWQRDNLRLRVVKVSSDEERLEKLCHVLTKTQVSGAAIMYVHQQWQAEAMANLLQERLVLDDTSKTPKTKWTKHKIAAYHAKMDPETKEKVRLGFLSGRVKLVIATIAFGMGIDKQNVRLVVHYHVPSSIEHYLQQVGRAGRDGRDAQALLFLLDDDVRAFRSLLFSNALHISQVRKLVELVVGGSGDKAFVQQNMAVVSRSRDKQTPACRHRVWMHVASLEQHLDMKAAMVETFLTLMSLHPVIQRELRVTIHPTAMSWCVVSLTETQLTSPQADLLLKRLVTSVKENDDTSALGHIEIDVDGYHRHVRVYFHVASAAQALLPAIENANGGGMDDQTIDIQSRRLLQRVRTWQANGLIRKFQMERSAFDLDLEWVNSTNTNAADHEQHRRNCVATWTQLLYDRHNALEAMEIKRLQHLYSALSAAAAPIDVSSKRQLESESEADEDDENEMASARANVLEEKLGRYFDEADAPGDADDQASEWRALTTPLTPDLVEAIERDIEVLTSRSPDTVVNANDEDHTDAPPSRDGGASAQLEWHGYNVARIFHGLASPCFPSKQWRDQLSWRKYNHVAFEKLVVIADKVLLAHASS